MNDQFVPQGERGAGSELADALAGVAEQAVPGLKACLRLARVYESRGEHACALQWAYAASDAGDDFAGWVAASRITARCRTVLPPVSRTLRVAILGSYTTAQLTSLLPMAAARAGVDVECYEGGYAQYRLDVLNPDSELHTFAPDLVVLAVHAGEVGLPHMSSDPEGAVENELGRWTSLWHHVEERLGARVVQHNFAIPAEVSLGHLAAQTPGSRFSMLQRLNARIGEAAGGGVSIVDCERLSAAVGKNQWFDARYFHLAKQAVGLNSVPTLARETAAVIAAQLGLSKKVLVLDLDNTLWGGVLGELGPTAVAIGSGPGGEAFSAFQRYILELKDKGVVLAICSKNNESDVLEVFETHPDMVVQLDDVAVMMASWEDKPSAVRRIASMLGVGLDSLVFVDDNPAEREAVRQLVPGVDVIPLPPDPAGYVRALSRYPFFETAALTTDDTGRTEQYRARAEAAALQADAGTIEEFLESLDMTIDISSLDKSNLPRVVQLIGKTNQFNVTSRRHSEARVASMVHDKAWVSQVVRLHDRFADHGIVGVLLAHGVDDRLDVDTWLLSCRVIGRAVEDEMFWHLVGIADQLGCRQITGTYIPTAKNVQVAHLFERLGFEQVQLDQATGATRWELSMPVARPTVGFIRHSTTRHQEETDS